MTGPTQMCRQSPLAPDWVAKGLHLKLNGIELAARPNGTGGVTFKPVFSVAGQEEGVRMAIRVANDQCLTNKTVRDNWLKAIESAMRLMISETGELRQLARGRLAELHFLRVALRRYN